MKTKAYIVTVVCIIAGVLLDQYTKFLAVTHLMDAPLPIIEGVFELRYLENRGAAFGLLQNQQVFFIITGILLLIFSSILYGKLPTTKRMLPLRICMIGICAGAIGNMIDRIRLNYVIDFLYFRLIDFPIFNVADIYVTLSTFGIGFLILFYYKEEELDSFFKFFSKKS